MPRRGFRADGIQGRAMVALALGVIVLTSVGCSQTTRVGEAASADLLAKSKKGIAVMRIGAASPSCRNVGLWLGVREGDAFRPAKPVAVIDHASTKDVSVAEVELEPGEYHVLSYACGTGSSTKQVSEPVSGGLVKRSYASFQIEAGEIVNVGSFEFHAARVGTNAFGRPVRTSVSVVDWPLADLERYRERRPAIFAQMKTRLMTVSPAKEELGAEQCRRLAALKAEGKVERLPATCGDGREALARGEK